jgi:hypothetical protein
MVSQSASVMEIIFAQSRQVLCAALTRQGAIAANTQAQKTPNGSANRVVTSTGLSCQLCGKAEPALK